MRNYKALTALTLVLISGSGCDPKTLEERLADGEAVRTSGDCDDSIVQDAFELLCTFIPSVTCTDKVNTCSSYKRQLFMGTSLSSTPPLTNWNYMGGRGDQMGDAIMCSLKELSQTKAGTQVSNASVNIGIGDVTVSQEIGLVSWDRVGPSGWPEFTGYRKLKFNLPVFGQIDAITQNIHITKNSFGYVRGADSPYSPPLAGGRPIAGKYGLTVETQEKAQGLKILPPSFEIATPIGPFNVQPEFSYYTQAAVIDSPYDGNAFRDLVDFLNIPGATVRLTDIYGVNAGVDASDNPVSSYNFYTSNTGWSSQLGLGNRDASVEPSIWSPAASGNVTRPDENFLTARSGKESEPTVEVKAGAKLRFPSDPHQLLPGWVFELPFLEDLDAYISIDTQIRAGFADQFNIGAVEGAYHSAFREFDFLSHGASFGGLWGGVDLAAGFSIIPGLRLLISLDLPFYGGKKIVDLDVKFPINFPEVRRNDSMKTVLGVSTSETDTPFRLTNLQTFEQNLTSSDSISSYINQCYQPNSDVPPQAPPAPTPPVPGDTTKLMPDHLWPCNICVFIPAMNDPAHGINIAQKSEYVLPSAETPSYVCNDYRKNGCQDWCTWDQETGQLHFAIAASDLKGYAEGLDLSSSLGGIPGAAPESGITNKAVDLSPRARFNGCQNP